MKSQQSSPPDSFSAVECEIDLIDLVRILAARKRIIIVSTIIFTILAIIYYMLVPKEYKAEAMVREITADAMVRELTAEIMMKVKSAETSAENIKYEAFLFNIAKTETKSAFFTNNDIKKEDRHTFKIRSTKENENNIATITLLSGNKKGIVALLDEYIEFADQITAKSVARQFEKNLGMRRKRIRLSKESKLVRLREALSIAIKADLNEVEAGDIKAVPDQPFAPLYMRGVKALQAEIEILKTRTNDDAFDANARQLGAEIALLKTAKPKSGELQTAEFIQKAKMMTNYVKPKPAIIILGMLSGLMLGIIIVFILAAVQKLHDLDSKKSLN